MEYTFFDRTIDLSDSSDQSNFTFYYSGSNLIAYNFCFLVYGNFHVCIVYAVFDGLAIALDSGFNYWHFIPYESKYQRVL